MYSQNLKPVPEAIGWIVIRFAIYSLCKSSGRIVITFGVFYLLTWPHRQVKVLVSLILVDC